MDKANNNSALYGFDVWEDPPPDTTHIKNKNLKDNIININSLKEEETTPDRKKTIKEEIKEFISHADGVFSIDDLIRDCGFLPSKRNAVKCALSDFLKEGVIERKGVRTGTYVPIRGNEQSMNDLIRSASTKPVPLRLPLAIDALLNVYNRNLIVIQGLSNSGKTAFLMEIARLNRNLFDLIKYINTEMDASEVRDRIERRNIDLEEFLSYVDFFLAKSTYQEGAIRYAIEPNGLNLVDYLHLEDATMMAPELDKIQERLDNGIAIVCIQKYFGKDMGYGGHGVKNRARLVIDLSKDVVTLKKVKSPKWWHKEIRLDESYRKFEYSKDGSIKPTSSWFTQDSKPFHIYSNGLEWEVSHVPVPDDEFVKED